MQPKSLGQLLVFWIVLAVLSVVIWGAGWLAMELGRHIQEVFLLITLGGLLAVVSYGLYVSWHFFDPGQKNSN